MKWIFKEEEIQCSAAGGLHPGTGKLLLQIAFSLYSTHWINFLALSPGDPKKFCLFRRDGGRRGAALMGEC